MDELMLKIDNVSKMYKLGQIGGTTLRDELQRKMAKMRGKEDPTKRIGAKDYNKGETFMALNGVSFEVKKGERVGIIGHNGAGKSTLLKLISRVTAPTSGTISMNGRVTSMLEVGTGFHAELTGRENIYMNGAILGMTKKEIDAKMEDIIEFSECRQFIDTPVKRYSSGMYVKLAFSVAAHLDSEIMIMDEVLAVGDMAFQKKCLDKMNDVSKTQGRTILYVSHNMNTIRQLCDRVVVLDHGKVVFDGDVEEGIRLYLDNNKNIYPKFIDLQDTERDKTFGISNEVKIRSIEILNKNEWTISTGEILRYQITICANCDVNNLGYRNALLNMDQSGVSMFSAQNVLNIKAGEEKKITFEADTSLLSPAKYYLNPVLYYENGYGQWVYCDHIQKAVMFEVEPTNDFNNGMEWKGNWWGRIRLPDLQVIKIQDAK